MKIITSKNKAYIEQLANILNAKYDNQTPPAFTVTTIPSDLPAHSYLQSETYWLNYNKKKLNKPEFEHLLAVITGIKMALHQVGNISDIGDYL